MLKLKKKIKFSKKRSKKCHKIIHYMRSEVNAPAIMHSFEVPVQFDTTLEDRFSGNKFIYNFESYIGIRSFTAFNKSTMNSAKKKSKIKTASEPGFFRKMLKGLWLCCESCIVSVWNIIFISIVVLVMLYISSKTWINCLVEKMYQVVIYYSQVLRHI